MGPGLPLTRSKHEHLSVDDGAGVRTGTARYFHLGQELSCQHTDTSLTTGDWPACQGEARAFLGTPFRRLLVVCAYGMLRCLLGWGVSCVNIG